MNYNMVKLLILKDWYLERRIILGSLVGAAIALIITVSTGNIGLYLGITLLVTVLIAVGSQLAIATTVNERKQKTLPFIMSLPISWREFTTAKMLAYFIIFLVPWVVIFAGCILVVLATVALPNGVIPFVAIMCVEVLVSNCLVFCVALMTESQPWAIVAIMVGNLAFNAFGYFVSHIPSINAAMWGRSALWSRSAVTIIFAEVAAIVLLLGLTFFVQSRKTDYL